MNISEKIRKRVQSRNPLELFSFDHIGKSNESHSAIAKELSRMCASGSIKRLKNGVYYKPKMSRFGEISPSENDVLKYLLFDERGKRIGYISGARLHNQLGFTSQVSGVITIASNIEKRSINFAGLRIRYVKAYGRINRDDISLLQLLDTLKDVDKIFDANISESIHVLFKMIQRLSPDKKKELIQIAQNYPPRVRAIVGAIMSDIWKSHSENNYLLDNLKKEIVNTSRFEYPNINHLLNNANHWNIYEPAP